MHTHHSINIHNVICQVKEKMGCSSKWGRVWGVSLASDTGCGRDARVPRGMSPNLDHTQKMGVHPGFLHSRCLNFGLRDMGMGCD